MRRDPILLLWILERVTEAAYEPSGAVIPLMIEGSTDEEISYHVLLLSDAGFIEIGKDDQGRPRPVRMRWQGHEYLDSLGENAVGDIGNVVTDRGEESD